MPAVLRVPVVLFAALALSALFPVVNRSAPLPDPGVLEPPNDPLPPGAVARLGTTRLRSPDGFRHIAISPDAKLLVTPGRGGLQVWDGRTGELLRTIPMLEYQEEPLSKWERERPRTLSEGVAAMAFTAGTGVFHVLTGNGLLRACDLTTGTWGEPLARTAATLPKESERWGLRATVSRRRTERTSRIPSTRWARQSTASSCSRSARISRCWCLRVRTTRSGRGTRSPPTTSSLPSTGPANQPQSPGTRSAAGRRRRSPDRAKASGRSPARSRRTAERSRSASPRSVAGATASTRETRGRFTCTTPRPARSCTPSRTGGARSSAPCGAGQRGSPSTAVRSSWPTPRPGA